MYSNGSVSFIRQPNLERWNKHYQVANGLTWKYWKVPCSIASRNWTLAEVGHRIHRTVHSPNGPKPPVCFWSGAKQGKACANLSFSIYYARISGLWKQLFFCLFSWMFRPNNDWSLFWLTRSITAYTPLWLHYAVTDRNDFGVTRDEVSTGDVARLVFRTLYVQCELHWTLGTELITLTILKHTHTYSYVTWIKVNV